VKPKIEKELSFSEIKNIITEISKFKPNVVITGGEPILRKDIIRILKYIEYKNLQYHLITNGSLINEEIANEIVKLNPSGIIFSLDGPEQIHDRIRGVKGTFKKVVKAINMIKVGSNIPITINCVISSINLPHIEKMIDLAENLNVDLRYEHLMFTNDKIIGMQKKLMKRYFNVDYTDTLFGLNNSLGNVDTDTLIKKIRYIKNKETDVKISFLPEISINEVQKYYTDIENYTYSDRCLFPWIGAMINPYGDVYPCIEFYAGNLKTHSFKHLYNNQKMKDFRRILKKEKLFPICARCCFMVHKFQELFIASLMLLLFLPNQSQSISRIDAGVFGVLLIFWIYQCFLLCYGYVINSYADREQDSIAGKHPEAWSKTQLQVSIQKHLFSLSGNCD
jgi:MoaA/NifB/PqqE/SkfB family radical SAM enzyme